MVEVRRGERGEYDVSECQNELRVVKVTFAAWKLEKYMFRGCDGAWKIEIKRKKSEAAEINRIFQSNEVKKKWN